MRPPPGGASARCRPPRSSPRRRMGPQFRCGCRRTIAPSPASRPGRPRRRGRTAAPFAAPSFGERRERAEHPRRAALCVASGRPSLVEMYPVFSHPFPRARSTFGALFLFVVAGLMRTEYRYIHIHGDLPTLSKPVTYAGADSRVLSMTQSVLNTHSLPVCAREAAQRHCSRAGPALGRPSSMPDPRAGAARTRRPLTVPLSPLGPPSPHPFPHRRFRLPHLCGGEHLHVGEGERSGKGLVTCIADALIGEGREGGNGSRPPLDSLNTHTHTHTHTHEGEFMILQRVPPPRREDSTRRPSPPSPPPPTPQVLSKVSFPSRMASSSFARSTSREE